VGESPRSSGVLEEDFCGMKPDETAVAADQHVGRDGWDQLSTSLGYREYYRVRIAGPVDVVARGAGELGSGCFECVLDAPEVVLSAVSFHDGSIPNEDREEGPRETFPVSSSSTVPG
jgi:hypothetical protein